MIGDRQLGLTARRKAAAARGLSGPRSLNASELRSALDGFRSRGSEIYQRALRAAVEDGYQLPPEHAAGVTATSAPPARVGPADLKALSTPADAPAPDYSRTAEEVAFDNSAMAPACDPGEYRLNLSAVATGLNGRQLAKLDNSARQMAADMGFSVAAGGPVMEQAFRDAKTYENMTEDQRTLYKREQLALLGRVVPDLAAATRNANAVTAMVSDKKFAEDFAALGGFVSARTIVQLDLQFRRLAARADMAKRRGG